MATEKWLCAFNINFHQIKVQNHDGFAPKVTFAPKV
jgi:hypothetical protein